MAIFTAIATFLATTFFAGTFLATTTGIAVMALGLGLATTIGVSYVMKALAGNTPAATDDNHFGTQGVIAAGGAVPRAFGLGYHVTAGSLVYANYWGTIAPGGTTTPNAYLTQVIALGDLPGEKLLEFWVDGELVTIGAVDSSPEFGNQIVEYVKAAQPYLWVKFYDGTQTSADPLCVNYASSSDRPYQSSRIGTGVVYAVVTALVEDTLWTGIPSFKFALSGIPLYDPTQDDTNGGSGSHRYSNPASWGGDGDQLPAVQAYNILRGIRYNGAWVYGLQNLNNAARLPAANWNNQIGKCRDTVVGLNGPEPSYRSGGQIDVSTQPANALDELLTACQGRISEIGGFYKIHVGPPDSSVFAWTDADLLSSEQQTFRPFFSLANSVNGIQGTYPDPAQAWQTATAPALYRTDLEAIDGNRRLMAAPAFNFVPYPEQVQRLQQSGIAEAQRARTHALPFPPAFWMIEPGDVGEWNSVRNGYVNKQFRVDSVVDRANLDLVISVTEVDPADYSWDHNTDYTGVSTGPTLIPRPPPQGVIDWYAEGTVLNDGSGIAGHAAIRIAWDGTLPGVVGIQYEVRLTVDLSSVTRGRTDQLAAGALIISQGILPQTAYQVRGQYLPNAPRDMLWSDWLDVTTPALPAVNIPAWIAVQVTDVMDYLNDRLLEVEQRLSQVVSTNGQRNWLDQKEVRSQLNSTTGAAMAAISEVQTAYTAADAAMASDITTLSTEVGTNTANITLNANAITTTNTAFSNYKVSNDAAVGANAAGVSTNATAIATLDGFAAAEYAVTLDVNKYAVGFNLINGGAGLSAAVFTFDKFQVAAPGVAGGAPVPIFTVANVGGSPKVAIRGDMYVDGTIAGSAIITGSLTATQIAANSITADRLVTGTITSASGKIGALSVNSLSISDFAVVIPGAETRSDAINSTGGVALAVSNVTLSIDTTGLAGKQMTIIAGFVGLVGYGGSGANPYGDLFIDGASVLRVQIVNSQDNSLNLAGSRVFTAGGGVENHTIQVQYTSGTTGSPQLLVRTLWAMVGKR
jgi:Putative phage tail protein